MITLECNGIEQSLEGWGITRAVLSLISLGIDTLKFDISVQDLFADPAFNSGDRINLFNDGIRVFSGQVTRMPVVGNANSETHSYTVSGPWYILSRVVYKQSRLVYNGVLLFPELVDSSRTLIFGGSSLSVHVNNGTMIHNAINYAVNVFHVPIQFGSTSLNAQPPMQEVRDITCADVILYSAKWTPDSVGWFDYSVDPPAFYCKRRSELDPVSIDPKNETFSLVTDFKVQDRPDLKISGVIFTFEQTIIVGDVQKVSLSSQQEGDLTSIDVVTHTFTLQGATDFVQELPPAGLASAFFAATSTLQYEGEVVLTEQDCTFLIRPGNRLLFTANCPAKYQTMNALVQQVQYELVTGITSVTFGPPNQLGPQDFAAMLAASRGALPVSNMGTTGAADGGNGNPPTAPQPNPFPSSPPGPGGGQPRIQVELCDGTSVCLLGATGSCGG